MIARIDPKSIATAMKNASIVAKTGSREERSGKFIAPPQRKALDRSPAPSRSVRTG